MNKGVVWSIVGTSAILLMLTAGCGSSGESTTSLSKAQFVRQGNAICNERKQERDTDLAAEIQTLKPGGKFSDAEQTDLVVKIIVPSYEKMATGLESLGSPEGDEAEVKGILMALKKGLKSLEADPEEAIFTTAMFNEANELMAKYGLNSCIA